MKANPGGQLSPSEVIGRDALIQRLWRVLERQSIVLSAERRMGKTSIVKKMTAEAPSGKLAVYRDLEGIRTPVEFVETIFHDVESYLSGSRKLAAKTRLLLQQFAGIEFSGVKFPEAAAPHWKSLLTSTIEDLVAHQAQQQRGVIFFWDEMPLMLYNIKQRTGEDTAMEILDTLRSLRQMHPDLRMVFTGSIGLHNVLTSLKRAGYANAPTNDMNTIDVPSLPSDEAQTLARQLLAGEQLQAADPQAVAHRIAVAVDGIPYFVHHVVDQLAQREGAVDAETVTEVVDDCLIDQQDPWHLSYYRERINTYYLPDELPVALNLLDVLATSSTPLSLDEVFNFLNSRMSAPKIEAMRDVLILLQRDHYVVQERNGTYRFRFPLIQRSWRLQRGLGA